MIVRDSLRLHDKARTRGTSSTRDQKTQDSRHKLNQPRGSFPDRMSSVKKLPAQENPSFRLHHQAKTSPEGCLEGRFSHIHSRLSCAKKSSVRPSKYHAGGHRRIHDLFGGAGILEPQCGFSLASESLPSESLFSEFPPSKFLLSEFPPSQFLSNSGTP